MGSVESALLTLSVVKQKMYSCKRNTFSKYKRIQQFFFQNLLNKIRLQAFLKSHFALKCKQLNARFIYHERNNCQDISFSLLKRSVEKFCCFHLEADIVMLFLCSRIREFDQSTPVLIGSEDTGSDVCACSINN